MVALGAFFASLPVLTPENEVLSRAIPLFNFFSGILSTTYNESSSGVIQKNDLTLILSGYALFHRCCGTPCEVEGVREIREIVNTLFKKYGEAIRLPMYTGVIMFARKKDNRNACLLCEILRL